MNTPEFDPELVERAARALFEVPPKRIIPWGEVPEWLRAKYENDALAVLTAVAPALMAQGAECSCGGSGLYPNEVPGVGTEWVGCPDCNRAEIEVRGYQRGMVAGARQILTTVQEAHDLWPVLVEQQPEVERVDTADPRALTLRVTQRLAWLTEREYRARFGGEPPTGPVLTAVREAVARIEKGGA